MDKIMIENLKLPTPFAGDPLTEVIADSVREILAAAVKAEARQWISERAHLLDGHGRRLVVANGYLPERQVMAYQNNACRNKILRLNALAFWRQQPGRPSAGVGVPVWRHSRFRAD